MYNIAIDLNFFLISLKKDAAQQRHLSQICSLVSISRQLKLPPHSCKHRNFTVYSALYFYSLLWNYSWFKNGVFSFRWRSTFFVTCLHAFVFCSLKRLYKDTQTLKKLLPKKRIFILHGSLLIWYLLIYAIGEINYFIADHSVN